MQDHAADQLDVEVAHAQHPAGRLAADREGLGQQRVDRLALGDALAKLDGPGGELLVAERLERGLERVDFGNGLPVALQHPLVAAAEDPGEECLKHRVSGGLARTAKAAGRTGG